MSVSEYEPKKNAADASPAPAEVSETERRARQIAQLVEAERRRRRRTILLCLGLLVVPVAIAAAGLLLAREPRPVSAEDLRRQVTPIVENKVGEQIRPVVEEKLGGQIDATIERRVGDKIQGASPAAVRELGENVERLKGDLSQVQAGVQEVQALKAALPLIRSQIEVQNLNYRQIQERITRLPEDGGEWQGAARLVQLENRMNQLSQKFENSFAVLVKRMEDNSQQLRAIEARISNSDTRGLQPKAPMHTQKAPAPKKQR